MEAPGEVIEAARVRCPRCGYALGGVVESWRESCAVQGVCSECGLGFEWADLLRVDRQRLPWLYEHAGRWWNAWAMLRTLWMLTLPWRFWGRVRVHHRVAWGRLASWPALASTFWSMMAAVVAGGVLCLPLVSSRFVTTWGVAPEELLLLLSVGVFGWIAPDPLWDRVALWAGDPLLRAPAQATAGFALVAGLMALVCPSEWRRARVRFAHLWRVCWCALAPLPIMLAVGAMVVVVESTALVGVAPTAASPGVSSLASFIVPQSSIDAMSFLPELMAGAGIALMLAWQGAYWWCAMRRGLQLERVWALWLICMAGGVLGGMALPAALKNWTGWY